LFRILWPLASGRAFEMMQAFVPEQLLAAAKQHGRVTIVSSPAQLQRMPQWDELAQLQPYTELCFSSGGPLSADAALHFAEQVGQAPLEIFGSTETGGIAWRQQSAGDAAWTPLPSVACEINQAGALALRSPFLPDASLWHTSDAAEWQPDGRFVLKGRLDRVVKLEEKRLALPEQEGRLAEHPWVAASALLVRPGHRQTLCAVAVLSADGAQQLALYGKRTVDLALRAHLARHYEPVLLPRRWRYVEALPLTERGKLCQASLHALFTV
jgi:acyl-coenzyme A synthetase/AMP-(fatty) acid ligase